MKSRLILLCILLACGWTAGICAPLPADIRYYFRPIDIRNGLSQNTVYQILQDRTGFMWFGTKDGLNRYDGMTCRIYNKDNSGLGRNYITVLCESADGHLWIGTDGGVFVYDPAMDGITPFLTESDRGTTIGSTVTMMQFDEQGNLWVSVEQQGIFCYRTAERRLLHLYYDTSRPNVSMFWLQGDICWVALYADNLYQTTTDFNRPLTPFRNADGVEVFKGEIVYCHTFGTHHRSYVATQNGLTEILLTNNKTRRLLDAYTRVIRFRSDDELWAGTENGLYICHLEQGSVKHLSIPDQDDDYALSDNAIYALCPDREKGMWIGSYFGGVNYHPYPWTYFEKFYPHEEQNFLGRRVREICKGMGGTLWIGTEDKGLFCFDTKSRSMTPFSHPMISKNVHGLCMDGHDLWVGTFAGGLNRIDLRTRHVTHYAKEESRYGLPANDFFSICRTSAGELWFGTTSGLVKYDRSADRFIRIPELKEYFAYHIMEDHDGNLWVATFKNGVFRYDVRSKSWKNYRPQEEEPSSLSYNTVISLFEDSRGSVWCCTLGEGCCRYLPATDNFVRYDERKGFPGTIYKMVEDHRGCLWITSNNGLFRFHPDTEEKHRYTTANGLLSDQFNFQSGYVDEQGRIYMGSIDGLIVFDPATFVENDIVPPVVITDFYLFNKRMQADVPGSPLKQSITWTDRLQLEAGQNSFSLQIAALSYQAPEMNGLEYRLEGFDREWYTPSRTGRINYSNLPYGSYTLRIRGSNGDGKWNPEERRLKIHILPPFYLSTTARIIYLLLVCGLLFFLSYYLRQLTRRRHRQAMKQLEHEKEREIYTAKIEFFTNVAHEIRTPLTLIKSPLENVLASPSLPDEVRDDLETMGLNTNRLLDLVNQLLDFRKTETRGFRLTFMEQDVTEIVRSTCKRFRPLAMQRGLSLTVEMPDRLMAPVDREAVTKIISNLLTNAVKYADSYIRIRLDEEQGYVCLTVGNDGPVVPADMREEIFKPFVQYHQEGMHTVSGTGIGLPLARSLAELHGGTLLMDETTDENRFRLRIPPFNASSSTFHLDGTPTAPRAGEQTDESAGNRPSNDKYDTLLIVEDNPDMLAFVARQFAPHYNVLTATNGAEALTVLQRVTVNIVISDIVMPVMDGFELCTTMKSELDYSHIPIILLTAKTTLQSKIEGMKHGADAYVEKPFSVEYLRVCVSNLLSNREKLRVAFAHSPFVQTGSVAMTTTDETFLAKLHNVVEENMQNTDFNIDEMASLLGMSRSNLSRKIKGLLDLTPNDYVRLERLKKAVALMREGNCRINEICYMVGFNTPSYFAKCFYKQFGVLPKDFLAKG